VVLKIFNNSQNITLGFLNEIANTKLVDNLSGMFSNNIVHCYGISQDPITKNYMMVMQYMRSGNLRDCLQNKSSKLVLKDRSWKLEYIVEGLKKIHDQNLIHRDLHSGNIVGFSITDLGLSQPASYQKEEGEIFGVLPYIAPEVLQGKGYTQASDIYSLGIIAYELFANSYPYPDLKDLYPSLTTAKEREFQFSLDVISNGLRPNIDGVPLPQLLKDLIKQCWYLNPAKRPTTWELEETIRNWCFDKIIKRKDSLFVQQYQAIKEQYNTFIQNTPYQIHPQAITTSKMIDTKQITEKLQQKILTQPFTHNWELDINNYDYLEQLENITNSTQQFTLKGFKSEVENVNWFNLHLNFTEPLITEWKDHHFTASQTQEWISVGLAPQEADFAAWLRDEKQIDSESLLNSGNLVELRREYLSTQQLQANIEVAPKQN